MIKLAAIIFCFVMLQGCAAIPIIQAAGSLGWGIYQNNKIEELEKELKKHHEEIIEEKIVEP